MNQVHLIMPMGGVGSRFKNMGYQLPKPLIEIHGKPFFYWATQSITKFLEVDITFVVLQEHVLKFQIDQEIKKYYPNAKIVIIKEVLNGAVLTCLEGIKEIHDQNPIIFNDCDHMFMAKDFYEAVKQQTELDGLLLSFPSQENKFSYLEVNQDNLVVRTVEKEVISHHAICGVYYFKNKDVFEKAVQTYLKQCNYQEYFISGVYNTLISSGGRVGYYDVDMHVSFGTPEEYEEAVKSRHFEDLIG